MRYIQRFRTGTMILLATTYLPGCMGWKTQNVAPIMKLKQPVPSRLRVQLADGRTVFLTSARVENDSLVGIERAEDAPGRTAGRTSFALSDVSRTETRGARVGTNVAILGGLALVGVFLALRTYEPNLR